MQAVGGSKSKRGIAVALLLIATWLPCGLLSAETRLLIPNIHRLPSFVYPIMGPRTSSEYGMRIHPLKRVARHHDGIDLAAPEGAPIRAIADGDVMYADPHGGYGRYITIRHRDGYTSHYGHCKTLQVAPGQSVTAGQVIGTVGNSGLSTGPHLHFEVRLHGEPRDPEKLLPGLDEQAAG